MQYHKHTLEFDTLYFWLYNKYKHGSPTNSEGILPFI